MTKITCFSVCVNYADFLSQTIKGMKKAVDDLIIVTSPKDTATKELCDESDVEVFETDIFWGGGMPFAKGKAVHEAMRFHKERLVNSWVLHLDSDILIDDKIPRNLLTDDECIYGCSRVHRIGSRRQLRPASKEELHYSFDKKSIGKTRRTITKRPAGFFQLWKFATMPCYPHCSPNAAIDDVVLSSSFSKTRIFSDFSVVHLLGNNEKPFSRKNWNGRPSPKK